MQKPSKPVRRYQLTLTDEQAADLSQFIGMGELSGPKLKYHLIHGKELLKEKGVEKMPEIVNGPKE